MNIVFVGDLSEFSRSRQRLLALRQLGHRVRGVSSRPPDFRAGITPISAWTRLRSKAGYPRDLGGVNDGLRRAIAAGPCDLLWVDQCLEVRPAALRLARRAQPGAALVSFSEDDMFARHNQSAYYRRALPLFDLVCTSKRFNARPSELPALGARRVLVVDKAFDPAVHRPLPVSAADRERLGAQVGFIGTFERERAETMLALAKAGIPVRVRGNGWKDWVGRHPLLQVEAAPVFGDDYVRALCATRINLCFLRKINRDQQTDRSFEIPACGGFMMAERTPDHVRLFAEGREAEFFASTDELIAKIRSYLGNEKRRAEVAAAGRQRCLDGGHTHAAQLEQVLAALDGADAREAALEVAR